jgi:hypothetical protein
MREKPIDPRQPTQAPAGSHEKLQVLAARHAFGLPLWHPKDNRKQSGPSEHHPNR